MGYNLLYGVAIVWDVSVDAVNYIEVHPIVCCYGGYCYHVLIEVGGVMFYYRKKNSINVEVENAFSHDS